MSVSNVIFFVVATSAVCAAVAWLIASLLARIRFQNKISSLQEELGIAKQHCISLEQNITQTNTTEQKLMQTFEALSSRVLHQNSSMYLQQTREQMTGFVEPLMRDLQKLETHIQNVEKHREGAYSQLVTKITGLGSELLNLQKANQELRTSAEHLHGALKSDTATRGKWGEIQLKRIVEMSGMVAHIDFEEQVSVKNDNRSARPDMVIHLPHEGVVPVDAKVPMNAYLKASAAQSAEEKAHYLNAHKNALKDHIKQLATKEYWDQFEQAPQLVILFLPYESGFEASVTNDPTLLDSALDKKVIIAGPSTLYAFLKVISYGWMQVELSKNASLIAKVSKELIQRFEKFQGGFFNIGKKLNDAVNAFNGSSRSLETRLLPKMQEIKKLRGDKDPLEENEKTSFIEAHARE